MRLRCNSLTWKVDTAARAFGKRRPCRRPPVDGSGLLRLVQKIRSYPQTIENHANVLHDRMFGTGVRPESDAGRVLSATCQSHPVQPKRLRRTVIGPLEAMSADGM